MQRYFLVATLNARFGITVRLTPRTSKILPNLVNLSFNSPNNKPATNLRTFLMRLPPPSVEYYRLKPSSRLNNS